MADKALKFTSLNALPDVNAPVVDAPQPGQIVIGPQAGGCLTRADDKSLDIVLSFLSGQDCARLSGVMSIVV